VQVVRDQVPIRPAPVDETAKLSPCSRWTEHAPAGSHAHAGARIYLIVDDRGQRWGSSRPLCAADAWQQRERSGKPASDKS
jgi:hypothetical protein